LAKHGVCQVSNQYGEEKKKVTYNGLAKLSWQNPKCGPSGYFFRRKFSSRHRLGRASFFAHYLSRAIPGAATFQFPIVCALEGRE
jgi:hypothetical protein